MKSNDNVVQLNSTTKVTIVSKKVTIKDLTITNSELSDYLSKHDDPARGVLLLLEAGLIMQRLTNSKADRESLRAEVDRLLEGGEDIVTDLEKMVKKHADPKDPLSLAATLSEAVVGRVLKTLDPTKEKSPLNDLLNSLIIINDRLNSLAGEKTANDNSPVKGDSFNMIMSRAVETIAGDHGDASEFVDKVKSETKSMVGDEIVTIESPQSTEQTVRVVWEYKTEDGYTQASALKELSKAMENRHAVAGVFALARQPYNASWRQYSVHTNNRMIIVVDKDNPDTYLIQYAYMWSRWMAIRSLKTETKDFSHERMTFLLQQAEAHLTQMAEIKKAITGVETSAGEARKWTNKVELNLKETLAAALQVMTFKDNEFEAIVKDLKS